MVTTKTVDTKSLKAKVSVQTVEGERTIVAVVSSGNPDREGDIVDVPSTRLSLKGGGYITADQLTGNESIDMPFLIDHNYSVESQIGSCRRAYVNDNNEIVCEFGVSSRPLAQDLMTLVDEGHISNSFSVTLANYTQDSNNVIYDAWIPETSLVFRGMNQDARLLAVKSLIKGEGMAEAKTLAEKKAELEALQKEINTEEAAQAPAPVETPAEAPKEEVKPAETTEEKPEVEEAKPVEEVKPETEAQPAEVETQPPQEEEKPNQETPTMEKSIAVKQVKDAPTQEVVDSPKEKELDKYDFVAKQFTAWVNGDTKTLEELNQKALDSYKTKDTGYQRVGAIADGGAIVPNNQLLTDVFTLVNQYSQVAADLRVVTLTDGSGIDYASLLADVVMTEVGTEGGNKAVTKLTLAKGNVSVREFAGIAVITKKLVRQAAVNIYDLLSQSFARAIARKRADLALTDSTSGIAVQTGVVSIGAAAIGLPTWAEIRQAPYKIPTSAVAGAKYYMSREEVAYLDNMVDSLGRSLDIVNLSGDGLTGTLANGFPFAVEEALSEAGAPSVVFGAMGRFGFILRQEGIENETFDTGSVVDGSTTHNLLQQNKLAQRVALYENVAYPLPGAFVLYTAKAS